MLAWVGSAFDAFRRVGGVCAGVGAAPRLWLLEMNTVHERLLALLRRHISGINAQSILSRSLKELGITTRELSTDHLPALSSRIERGVRLFLPPSEFAKVQVELKRMCAPTTAPASQTVEITTEPDISTARAIARGMCDRLGARRMVSQKVATVVSELARNIFMYAGTGTVELCPSTSPRPRMLLRAVDSGPGIPNLDEVLSGKYRSKTGLGAGLRGTKLLADRFDVQTGATGTRIEVEISL